MKTHLLRAQGLTVDFTSAGRTVRIVGRVDFTLDKGETLAFLGESGSGKSVTLRSLMRLLPPHARIGGRIEFEGADILALSRHEISRFRGARIGMIFQDPTSALDPVFSIGDQIAEAVRRHDKVGSRPARQRAIELLDMVQIPSPERRVDAYPHELSGGMRQRAMIALALSCNPQVLLCDEPTTALDASVQIQILLLLRELQAQLGMAMIFVTHDIGVAVEIADNIGVMYAGSLVETAAVRDLIRSPQHPYAHGLLLATTRAAPRGTRLPTIAGSPPDFADPPPGCRFAPRCTRAEDDCTRGIPPAVLQGDYRMVRCLHPLGSLAPPRPAPQDQGKQR